jgi:hypothetical protein
VDVLHTAHVGLCPHHRRRRGRLRGARHLRGTQQLVGRVLHNQLAESTAIHFHGIVTSSAVDGVPGITQDPVDPGWTFRYRFTAQSTPAVGMYDSHQDAVKQDPNELAGAFLIGDEPVRAGDRSPSSRS